MADEQQKKEQEKKPRSREERPAGGGEGRPKGKRPPKGAAAPAAEAAPAEPREPEPKVTPRLKERYENEIVPALMRELKIENRLRVPRLDKVVINMSLA